MLHKFYMYVNLIYLPYQRGDLTPFLRLVLGRSEWNALLWQLRSIPGGIKCSCSDGWSIIYLCVCIMKKDQACEIHKFLNNGGEVKVLMSTLSLDITESHENCGYISVQSSHHAWFSNYPAFVFLLTLSRISDSLSYPHRSWSVYSSSCDVHDNKCQPNKPKL